MGQRADYKVIGVYKETGSGVKLDRAERKKVMALAQAREIDAILVTELSRWGRVSVLPSTPLPVQGIGRTRLSGRAARSVGH